ncbi:hypothetical protein ISS04_03700 [Candidatus Woesearchaeota archaeon]|nr:hypothetical protein [Candidatus Woesearchaeota archaeon]
MNRKKPVMDKRAHMDVEFSYLNSEKQDLGETLSKMDVTLSDSYDSNEDDLNAKLNHCNEQYQEIINPGGLPNAVYYATPNAIREIMGFKPEYGIYPLEDMVVEFDEGQINKRIMGGEVYIFQGGLEPSIETLSEEYSVRKYLLANYEDKKDLDAIKNFVEVNVDSPLRTDSVMVSDLDEKTRKKINNLEYGGSNHDPWEPIEHAWEDDHARD